MLLYTQRWKGTSIPDELHTEILTLKEYNANLSSKQKNKRTDSSAYEITLKLQKSFKKESPIGYTHFKKINLP